MKVLRRNVPEAGGREEGERIGRRGGSLLLQISMVLLLGTGALLVWVGWGTLEASSATGVRKGLDYEIFLDAVSDLLTEAGDSTLLRVDEVRERLPGGRVVTFDTLAIIADVRAFPSLDRGGFLYDQVRAYNRFERERLALAREDPGWWDRLRAFNPSIFRPDQRPDGSRGVTRAPMAWSLRVPSPLEGEWRGEVRARDVVRSPGLMSPRVRIPLRKPASLLLPVGDREQVCEFVPASPEVRVYCLSEERIAQATLRLQEERRGESWAVAGWADLSVDGRGLTSGDSLPIREGSILGLEPLEPVMFGEYWEGVFSSRQWVNGRMRRRSDLPPPLDLFATLGGGSTGTGESPTPDASVRLSVRAEASVGLTTQLSRFLESEVGLPVEFGTTVLARIPDGAIVSVAEVGERRHRGRSSLLERVAPGSAVKPLLAAAILSRRPELGSMEVPARTGKVSSVLGMPHVGRRRAFTTSLNCGMPRGGRVDLRYFLRCSNNDYAASLMVAGLVEEGVPGRNWGGAAELHLEKGRVPRGALLRSPLSEGLSGLFDLPTDPVIADRQGRSARVWARLSYSDGIPFRAPVEVMPAESRPALLAPGSPEGTDLGLLYRYAYGAWENQWTLLDLTEGFGRVVTDRRIRLSFAPEDTGGALRPDTLGLGQHPWYSTFLSGLAAVGVDGTAPGLQEAWTEAGLPPLLYTKTGTLNEAGQPGPGDDLFAKALLFAVGSPESGGDGTLECGLVGGLYLRFAQGPASGNLPSYQVEFARERLGAFLRENWEAFGVCPGR